MLNQLVSDIGSLWAKYSTAYLNGIANTLILATTATLIGCVIGFLCGILQTIPCGPNENIVSRILLTIFSLGPQGIVCSIPHRKPITQPIRVAVTARISVLAIPVR